MDTDIRAKRRLSVYSVHSGVAFDLSVEALKLKFADVIKVDSGLLSPSLLQLLPREFGSKCNLSFI